MSEKNLVKGLGYTPKNKTSGVFFKTYSEGYSIEIDFDSKIINYGKDIKSDSKTTQNFSKPENFVVLECVDRLLEKGYKPKDIFLEKTYHLGHNNSGRLDILVKNGKKSFMMIECKTYGKEFEKELANIQKNGGQLFTYFQNDTNTEYLMLYTSHLINDRIDYRCEIIKIEDSYRNAGNVEDVYNRWNKISISNGIFEADTQAYIFKPRFLVKKDLVELTEEHSGKIFNAFASILRKHSVSDKPNAFNKIFNLFLAKLYDEKKGDDEELDFQWKEGKDIYTDENETKHPNPVDFQIRLINLHKAGLFEFLHKEIVGISDTDFIGITSVEELYQKKKDRLKFDKLFDIKEVFDDESFDDNFRVLKEVVQLLEKYRIRYPRRQRHLSDFFERLLTTGLKQEAGQYFTPVPITHFIIRSLPISKMIEAALANMSEGLPAVIDYAAGSGHFITEILETYQDIIDELDAKKYREGAARKIKAWQNDQYSWATHYIYGIEKDYRLVKVAKVGCYFYGDGLAQIFHADGLDSFSVSKIYKGLLKDNAKKPQFDIVVSNPPYSVDAFKGDLRNRNAEKDFTLYENLTDRSSEIECLFVERTAHLLKEGGVAGIILPSSMLSNTGIYTKTREIILSKFEIIAVAALGSNTFMATGTNTVILFMRRRKDSAALDIKEGVATFLNALKDMTIGGVENAVTKYARAVWNVSAADYSTLYKKEPNDAVKGTALYKEYYKSYPREDLYFGGDTPPAVLEKMKEKYSEAVKRYWKNIAALEAEKLFYFILAYPQKTVLIKTGEKAAEKRFLGYEFSNRRGFEGIHPILRGKTINECTKLFDDEQLDNPEKASAYIYKAFSGDYEYPIHESLKENVFRVRLVDMLAFDRKDFEKTLSIAAKQKIEFESRWKMIRIGDVLDLEYGRGLSEKARIVGKYPVIGSNGIVGYHNKYITNGPAIIVGRKGSVGKITIIHENCYPIDTTFYVRIKDDDLLFDFCAIILKTIQHTLESLNSGVGPGGLNRNDAYNIQIPLPPKDIQEKIIAEITSLEEKEAEAKEKIKTTEKQIFSLLEKFPKGNVEDLCFVSGEKCNPQDNPDAEYLYLGLEHIKSNTGLYNANFAKGKDILSEKYVFHKNDVLYGKLRPYLNKAAIAKEDGICSTDILVLKTDVPIILKYILLSDEFVRQTTALMKGVSLPRIGVKDFLAQKIPLPSFAEQQEIIAKIKRLEDEIQSPQKLLEQTAGQKELYLKKYL
jgi:type I restriction enzyme M protein